MKEASIRMSGDVAEVLLYDQIGADPFFGDGISAKTFREQIKEVKAKTINLRINSPGGSVTEGAAMLAALDSHKARIEVNVDGIAASAASVVAMAGDVIRVSSSGLIMIHDPYAGVQGGAEDMRRMAGVLDKVKGQILDAYSRHSKLGRDELASMMAAETWLTGQEAVDAGLADEVVSGEMVVNFSPDILRNKFKYKNVPKPKGPTPEQLEAIARRKQLLVRLAV